MRTVVVGVVVSALYIGCGDDAEPQPERTPGMGGEPSGDGAASGDGPARGAAGAPTGTPLGGSGPAADDEAGAGTGLGGSGTGLAGEAGEAAGGAGRGSSEEAGGASGAPAGAAGSPEAPAPLNGCIEFVDGRPSPEHRVIPWDYSLGHDPRRCLLVQVGQAVTWQGPFATHPIQRAGGTMPSPILGDTLSDDTSYQVAFDARGTYGYECGLHASMRGAIRVVE